MKIKDFELDQFTTAYIETALWSSNDDEDKPLDQSYSVSDFADKALEKIVKDCQGFQEKNRALIDQINYGHREQEWSRNALAGHDFWLTRNRHGAGFWDRGLGELGDTLTRKSHAYNECYIYVSGEKLYLG